MDINQLEKIGLKEKEAKAYIALLKLGSCLANHLAKETNILRSSIYDYLDILLDKGFITYTIKSGKKYFQAVDPEKILDNFREQKTQQENTLLSIIPELAKLKNSKQKGVSVKVFEGKQGMKSAMAAVIRDKPKEILAHGSSGVSYRLIPYYMHHWHRQRVKQKSALKIIFNNIKGARERLKHGPKLIHAKVKLMKTKDISFASTVIWNDKVLISIWNLEAPLSILIESKTISKNYRQNFQVLWKNAIPHKTP